MGIYIPPTWIPLDSINRSGDTLVNLNAAHLSVGQVAYPLTVGRKFRLLPGSLPVDNITVVNALNLPGYQWMSDETDQNPVWQARMKWSVSWAFGDDENDGGSDTASLKTWQEVARRTNGARYLGTPEVRLLDSSPTSDIFRPNITCRGTNPSTFFGGLWITGVPQLVYKGTISAANFVGVENLPSTGMNTITDAGANFAALAGTPGYIAARLNGTLSSFILLASLGGGQCQISVPMNIDPTAGNFGTLAEAPLAPGDTYAIYKLPDMPDVVRMDSDPNTFVYVANVNKPGSFNGIGCDSGVVNYRACSFAGVVFMRWGGSSVGCCFWQSNGVTLRGSVVIGGAIVGNSTFFMEDDNDVEMITVPITCIRAPIHVSHRSFVDGMYLLSYNVTAAPCLTVSHDSRVNLSGIGGSGNTTLLVLVRDTGCLVSGNFATWTPTATTQSAAPYGVKASTYAQGALPATDQMTTAGAGIVAN